MTRVCVTGASGFVASWLVKLLLERGYTVRGSVRSLDNLEETAHLMNLPDAKDRLHLFKADLQDEGSFDSAIEDCEGVFHTACPCFVDTTDPQMWYPLCKTLAEKEAWKYCEEHGIDMVAINPAMVLGALLQPTMNFSSEAILKLLNGVPTYPNAAFGWVHVKDVVEAHLRAYEEPSASGRYLCVQRVAHYEEIVEILRKMHPKYRIPIKCTDESGPRAPAFNVSTKKLEIDLSLKLLPIEEAIKDCADCLISQNFVKSKT